MTLTRRNCLWLLVVAVAVLLPLSLHAWHRLSLARRVESELAAIRHLGYPVTLAELERWHPPPPGDEDAANVLREAFANYSDPYGSRGGHLPNVDDQLTEYRGRPLPDDVLKALAEKVDANAKALLLLHEAAHKKSWRFPLPPRDAFGHRNDPTLEMLTGTRLMAYETLARAEQKQSSEVVTDIGDMLRLGELLTDEPDRMAESTRIKCEMISGYALEHALNRLDLTEDQLLDLQQTMAAAEDPQGAARDIAIWLCFKSDNFQRELQGKYGATYHGPLRLWLFWQRASGSLAKEYIAYLNLNRKLLAAAQLPLPDRLHALDSIDREMGVTQQHLEQHDLYDAIEFAKMGTKFDAANTAILRAAQTVLALERYQLAQRKLPEQLDELVPSFLAAVPPDPFDGKPLRYKKTERGFVVYSVGPDGKDDGGKEVAFDRRAADSVYDITFAVER